MKQNFSKEFKAMRFSLNLTQVELAAKLSVAQGSIADIERGRIGVSRKMEGKLKSIFNIDFPLLPSNSNQNKVINYCPNCGHCLK